MKGVYDRKPIRCPHCRRSISTDRLAQHEPRCTHNPEWMPVQRAALDDGTGTIRSVHNYGADTRGALSVHTLGMVFRTWADVAAHYGLAVAVRVKPDKRTTPTRLHACATWYRPASWQMMNGLASSKAKRRRRLTTKAHKRCTGRTTFRCAGLSNVNGKSCIV